MVHESPNSTNAISEIATNERMAANSASNGATIAAPKNAGASVTAIIPPHIEKLFGSAPLLIGEDPALYQKLLEELAVGLAPQSIVEWLWVKDVADYSWEVLRNRRFKKGIIDLSRKAAIAEIMRKAISRTKLDRSNLAEKLASEWFSDPKGKDDVKQILDSLGLTEECIDAQALSLCSNTFTTMDDLEGKAIARRDTALRERIRWRAELIQSRKKAADVVVDAEDQVESEQSGGPVVPLKSA